MLKTMKGLAYGFMLILCLGAWNNATAAPTTYYNDVTGNYYAFSSGLTTWQAAEDQAVALGGHLVAIGSADEQSYIEKLIASVLSPTAKVWIGFTDQETEGTWVWSNGEDVNYTNWHSGEPNNLHSGEGEDFAMIHWWSDGTWNDTSDVGQGRYYQGVMEFTSNPAATPIPGAAWLLGTGLMGLVGLRRKMQA
ncbi:MAG: hypothetical protein H0S80_05415 [Desulfovibrionaceae bacterium]|nr:hypothetical protein [Desulfovibrionaceae bacterium]